MTSRFPLDLLKPGMILKAAVMYEGGLLLSKGTSISDRHIKQMRAWGVKEFEVDGTFPDFESLLATALEAPTDIVDLKAVGLEPPEPEAPKIPAYEPKGYELDDGATFIIDETITYTSQPIAFNKNVLVQGGIAGKVELHSTGDISVTGEVRGGARLIAGGKVTVRGAIEGTIVDPVVVKAAQAELQVARFASINVAGDVKAKSLYRCGTHAGASVIVSHPEQGIIAGETEANANIIAESAGGDGGDFAVLRISNTRQKQLFLAVSKIEKAIGEKTGEIARLEKVIEVIRLLGEKVVQLPQEKKQEMAAQSKRYMELKSEVAEHLATKERIARELEEDKESFEDCPIRITHIFPGVEIVLGSSSLKVNNRVNTTGYYQKHGRILAQSL